MMTAIDDRTSMKRLSRTRLPVVLSLALGLSMLPGTASAWWSHDWSYRKAVTLDGTPTGAKLGEDLSDATVLVRLHDGNFKFADAAADGADLRFVAEDDKTPLKYHIEKYDAVFNLATVWVRVPRLASGAPTPIWLYYGNLEAASGSEPQATYDTAQTLVYHFGEREQPPADATVFAHAANAAIAANDDGLIGGAARFEGKSVIGIPGSPALATETGAAMTWSAWVKPAAPGSDGVIYSRRDGARAFIVGLDKGAPFVEVAGDGAPARRSAPAPALANAWHHLAVNAQSNQITLFIDGRAGPVLAAPLPALAAAATLGGDGAVASYRGEIDELQIANVARGADFIGLAAANQGADDRLVGFGVEEQLSSWSSGYVGIILQSVTLDGWIVIGILAVMAFISWIIMWTKSGHIQRIAKANKAFLKLFHAVGADWGALSLVAAGRAAASGIEISERERRQMQQSPLLHMFNAGVEELQTRLSSRKHKGREGPLSSRAIEAIRATLDSSLVTEVQSLNRLMVLLTIAISGGPFLGLLGTVVGVMITFAAIAASGDVNVNSIAPGIAAALVATVAGLVVAIPALFGYNYLISRIKEIAAEMHVFLDAFVTRMAEGDDAAETLLEARA